MDLKNRIPCAIMNQGKSMLIDKTSILSQNLGHYPYFIEKGWNAKEQKKGGQRAVPMHH